MGSDPETGRALGCEAGRNPGGVAGAFTPLAGLTRGSNWPPVFATLGCVVAAPTADTSTGVRGVAGIGRSRSISGSSSTTGVVARGGSAAAILGRASPGGAPATAPLQTQPR